VGKKTRKALETQVIGDHIKAVLGVQT